MFAAAGKLLGVAKAPPVLTNDPFIANVTFLMHGEGANNGTVFNEFRGHAATRIGNTVTSNAQAKFGSTSLSFDGASALSFAAAPNLAMGAGDFTMETWAFQTARSAGSSLITASTGSGSSGIVMQVGATGLLTGSTASAGIGGGGAVPLNQWAHLAFSKNSGTLRMYINGALVATFADSNNYTDQNLWIAEFGTGSQKFTGFLDEIRLTPGVGRYPTAFTPPTAAFLEV